MSSIIKVDTIQDQDGNNIINENANTVTIGKAGDSINVASGSLKDASGNIIVSKSGTTVTLGASGDTVSVAAGASFVGGGLTWQTVKTTGFTAVAGEGYFCNTTSSAFTATLPASATLGDEVSFIDYAGTFNTNNLTVGRNGHNINGAAADLVVNIERAGLTLVYVDSTQGWVLKDK